MLRRIVCLVGALVGATPVTAQTTPVLVARSGTPAPAGGTYGSFGLPVVGGSGQVAFYADLIGGSSSQGIFVGAPGRCRRSSSGAPPPPPGATTAASRPRW